MTWTGEESHTTNLHGPHETDWTVIDSNQASVGYHSNGGMSSSLIRPIQFEVEDLKCIRLFSISDSGIHFYNLSSFSIYSSSFMRRVQKAQYWG